ncbi:hypothetical protein [Alkalicoccobacillus murimartini]|uniref:Uncharacterized protein n=1 Tax=Alkalicoccobacillus murimartini TaxID=171685 RepID=A0ABT9YE60_9BACI|nr:hypothetical protein [Alkalicoccobacillus murimartini]MDQ0205482.1 hypothetical protein [Alkalicoccobacillus murimartini]
MKYNVEAYSFILVIHRGIIKRYSIPSHMHESLRSMSTYCKDSVDTTMYRKMVHAADIHHDMSRFRKITKQNLVFLDKFSKEFIQP